MLCVCPKVSYPLLGRNKILRFEKYHIRSSILGIGLRIPSLAASPRRQGYYLSRMNMREGASGNY